MKDRLEEFVKENREGFDSEIPRSDLWSKIEGSVFAMNPRLIEDPKVQRHGEFPTFP